MDTMKSQTETSLADVKTSLTKLTAYDKELRLAQASLRQAHKEIKSLGDRLGEQIFNLEEKAVTTNQLFLEKIENLKNEMIDMLNKAEVKENDKHIEMQKIIEAQTRDEIRLAFPDYQQRIMELVYDITNSHKELAQQNLKAYEEEANMKFGSV